MKLLHITVALILTSVSSLTEASSEWNLNQQQSALSFISTKKASIAETNTFKSFTGSISAKGEVFIQIDLSSVETNIPIRNERMQKHLFNTDKFATATATTKIEPKVINQLKPGDSLQLQVPFNLALHGKSINLTADISVVLLNENELMVSAVSPVIVNAGQFDLLAGINKLKELAGLDSISTAVPVAFNLKFVRAE